MLQSRNLDNQRFEEIVEHAIGRIPQLCPQWTNHNPSDPGITMLELLAWYKEMQQYHMNRCTEEIRSKLLKLAGGEIRPAAAAKCGIQLREKGEHCRYGALTRLETPEGVVFELLEEIPEKQAEIAACLVTGNGGYTDVTSMLDRRDAGVQPFRFGDSADTQFLIALSALPEKTIRLWFEVRQPLLTGRNPFADDSQVPRVIQWHWEGAGEAQVLSDETHALSQSGYITFSVPEGMEKISLWNDESHWYLRAVLEDPGCEETVCLTAVEAGRYRASQQETWSQSRLMTVEGETVCTVLFDDALAMHASFTVFLRTVEGWCQMPAQEIADEIGSRGIALDSSQAAVDGEPNLMVVCADPIHYGDLFHASTGLPDQTIVLDLGGRQALTEGFGLICDSLQLDGSIRPEIWRCVDDFSASGPRDRVFVYDPALETIRFGNGRNGAIVPRGENAIFLADLVLSDCGAGNIPEGGRLYFVEGITPVWSTAAAGGADRETIEAATARFLRRLEHPNRCVSAVDYETQARKTPGLRVASARAIPGYDPKEPTGRSRHPVVTVVVIPANQDRRPVPDERFLMAVQAHLDRHRIIGTVVRVVGPQYIGITVSAQLRTSGPVDQRLLQQIVADYLTVGRGGRNIGDPVILHEVSIALQQLPGVLAVERLRLNTDSAGCTETGTGDILLPKNAVAYLKDCLLSIR